MDVCASRGSWSTVGKGRDRSARNLLSHKYSTPIRTETLVLQSIKLKLMEVEHVWHREDGKGFGF